MPDSPFARTPKPPYYAVIFSSQRSVGDAGYAATSVRMAELAAEQPGFLGLESARDAEGFGLTVSYWDSEAAIAAWRRNAEHRIARETGRARWYEDFQIRVSRVERDYSMAGGRRENGACDAGA